MLIMQYVLYMCRFAYFCTEFLICPYERIKYFKGTIFPLISHEISCSPFVFCAL